MYTKCNHSTSVLVIVLPQAWCHVQQQPYLRLSSASARFEPGEMASSKRREFVAIMLWYIVWRVPLHHDGHHDGWRRPFCDSFCACLWLADTLTHPEH